MVKLASILARHANWRDMTSWRPRARVCEEIRSSRDPSKPLSITAYRAARRVLEERGFLGLVAQGWTSALRASALDDGASTCAVFVLTIPRRVNRALALASRREAKSPTRAHMRAREADVKDGAGTATQNETRPAGPPPAGIPSALSPDPPRPAGSRPGHPGTRPCAQASVPEHVRSLCRPLFLHGWSAASVLEALDHEPSGRQRSFTAPVRHPPGWAAARLAEWRDRSGRPLPSPSQRRAADRERVRAEQQAARQARQEAAERAARVDVAAQAPGAGNAVGPGRVRQSACNEGRQASLTKASGTLDASGMTDQRALEILQDYLGPAYFRDFDGDPPLPPELLWGLFTSYCENYLCATSGSNRRSRTAPPGSVSQPWKGSLPAGY